MAPCRQAGRRLVWATGRGSCRCPDWLSSSLTKQRDDARTREGPMPSIVDRMSVLRHLEEESSQLVEVLPVKEYDEEHIAGAINLPLKELNRASATQLDPSRPVITYCHDFL